jgi:hypothetical protein
MGAKRGLFNLGEEIKIASVCKLITQDNTLNFLPKDNKEREINLRHNEDLYDLWAFISHSWH